MQNQNIDISKIKAPIRPKDLRTISEEEFQAYIEARRAYVNHVGLKELERRGECRIKY